MNSKEITSIALKFFGIDLVVDLVFFVPTMVLTLTTLATFGGDGFGTGSIIFVVGSCLVFGLGISFVLFRLANSIVLQMPESSNAMPTLSQEFLLQVLGVYFIVTSFSVAPAYVVMLLTEEEPETSKLFSGLGHMFQAAVGCYLLVKPVAWRQWLNRALGR